MFLMNLLKLNNDKNTVNNDKNILIEKAKSIHNNIITLDTHCDIDVNNFTESINYSQNIEHTM